MTKRIWYPAFILVLALFVLLFFLWRYKTGNDGNTSTTLSIAPLPLQTTQLPVQGEEVLDYPHIASQTQNSITVSIVGVYADSSRIALDYMVEGIEVPEEFMLPCPILKTTLTNGQELFPEFIYSENTNNLRTRCYEIEGGVFLVTQNFYQARPFGGDLNLEFEVTVGGMSVYSEDGQTLNIPNLGNFQFTLPVFANGRLTLISNTTEEAEGISVILSKVEISKFIIEADLCIRIDDDKEWKPVAYLNIENERVQAEWYDQVDQLGNLTTDFTSNRCFRFTFPLMHALVIGATATMTLDSITIDDFGHLTQDDCLKALTLIQETHPQVDFVCHIETRGDGTSFWFEVISRPTNISEEVVFSLFRSSLQSKIEGPWTFAFAIP